MCKNLRKCCRGGMRSGGFAATAGTVQKNDADASMSVRVRNARKGGRRGGATTLEKYNQAKSKQDAGFSFYHATTLESALQIQEAGFRVPTGPSEQKAGALLGSGVYCTVTLQKAMKYCDGPHGGIIFELAVDLGKCKTLGENDPMMTTWQQHGYDSAWAPTGAGGRGAGLEENCIKDPKRIKIKQAIAGHSYKLRQAGYHIVGGKILQME